MSISVGAERQPGMRPSVQWFEIAGNDGEALRRFYRDLFGWRISQPDPGSDLEYGIVEPGYGGIAGGIGTTSDGVTGHVTFFVEVESPARTLERATQLGGHKVRPPTTIDKLNVSFAYLADPEGHVIGLSRNAGVGGRGDAGSNPVLSFEVMGRDVARLRAFYGELFGWPMKEAAAFDYWVAGAGSEGVLGGIGPASAAGQNGRAGFATVKVDVEDPRAALTRAEKLGGRVVMPVVEVPGTSFGIAYLADPEGNVVGLTRGMADARF
jgi:predicted enzyme related to lactoylglutathione lyase